MYSGTLDIQKEVLWAALAGKEAAISNAEWLTMLLAYGCYMRMREVDKLSLPQKWLADPECFLAGVVRVLDGYYCYLALDGDKEACPLGGVYRLVSCSPASQYFDPDVRVVVPVAKKTLASVAPVCEFVCYSDTIFDAVVERGQQRLTPEEEDKLAEYLCNHKDGGWFCLRAGPSGGGIVSG